MSKIKIQSLSKRIIKSKEQIIETWYQRLCEIIPTAKKRNKADLLNRVPEFIDQLAASILPKIQRSPKISTEYLAKEHGEQRAYLKEYSVIDVVTEYRLLRETLLTIVERERPINFTDSTLLHQVIDRGIAEAITQYVKTATKREDELRDRYIAMIAHDLRTPLTAVKMIAQVISHSHDKDDQLIKNMLKIIEKTDRANQLIQNLLDLSQISTGNGLYLSIQNFDFRELVTSSLEELKLVYGDRFELIDEIKNTSAHGYWDCSGIKRILDNICSNAVKYGDSKYPISIRIWAENENICLSVHNQGKPISITHQATLFEPFKRSVEAYQSGQKGWGLGLSVVKSIVTAHHGKITVQSNPDDGTLFTVKLPLDARKFSQEHREQLTRTEPVLPPYPEMKSPEL